MNEFMLLDMKKTLKKTVDDDRWVMLCCCVAMFLCCFVLFCDMLCFVVLFWHFLNNITSYRYIIASLYHCVIISPYAIVSYRAMEETRKMIKEKEREKERDDESKDGDVDVDASGHRRTFRARLVCMCIF